MRSPSVRVAATLLALHLLSFCAPNALAQGGVCRLGVEQSPRLRGLRLGMTAAQLKQAYPRLPDLRVDELGQAKATFANPKDVDAAAFELVESVNVNFVDDRLVEFQVFYENVPFESLDQFVARLSESVKLPGVWVGEGYGMRTLTCEGFEMVAGATSYSGQSMTPYVRLRQPGAEAVVSKRAEEKRERRRRAFKP
jgi:hypothetical protein